MGSPTLMGRICHILLRLKDDRHSTDNSIPALTLVLLNLEWSQLHLMITRSTTPDILKMSMKLIEFFNAQLINSKHLLASVQYDFRDGTKHKNIEKESSNQQSKYDTNIIKRYIGMNGGEIMLQGHNLTVVVFHGLNFKSRQWALFSLNEPQINFVTDRGEDSDSMILFENKFIETEFFFFYFLVNQKLFFYLGHQSQTTQASLKSRTNMASISKVTRNSTEAPSHLTINEWFNYASSTISAVGKL
jgi:Fragile site-associated protein C-terminus